jgi:hypothetical protein
MSTTPPSSAAGGSGPIRALYGVWIDQALAKNDVNEMKKVLQEARKHFPPAPQPLYGVWINHCLQSGASREDLQHLLDQAKATQGSDLQGAIQKLEAYLAKK